MITATEAPLSPTHSGFNFQVVSVDASFDYDSQLSIVFPVQMDHALTLIQKTGVNAR